MTLATVAAATAGATALATGAAAEGTEKADAASTTRWSQRTTRTRRGQMKGAPATENCRQQRQPRKKQVRKKQEQKA